MNTLQIFSQVLECILTWFIVFSFYEKKDTKVEYTYRPIWRMFSDIISHTFYLDLIAFLCILNMLT